MVHREPLNETVGSRSTFPNRDPTSSSNSETVQQILQEWIEVSFSEIFWCHITDFLFSDLADVFTEDRGVWKLMLGYCLLVSLGSDWTLISLVVY